MPIKFLQTRRPKPMLSRCANPQCGKPFLRLREGRLFLVETDGMPKSGEMTLTPSMRARQQQRVERYWLCDECAARWTLVYDRQHGVSLAPLRRTQANVAATHSAGDSGVV